MTYIRKTRDIWAIQGQYEGAWEAVSHYETRKEAQGDLRLYGTEEPRTSFRIKTIREAIEVVPAGWDRITGGETA